MKLPLFRLNDIAKVKTLKIKDLFQKLLFSIQIVKYLSFYF